jgi:hypothetical protein
MAFNYLQSNYSNSTDDEVRMQMSSYESDFALIAKGPLHQQRQGDTRAPLAIRAPSELNAQPHHQGWSPLSAKNTHRIPAP